MCVSEWESAADWVGGFETSAVFSQVDSARLRRSACFVRDQKNTWELCKKFVLGATAPCG